MMSLAESLCGHVGIVASQIKLEQNIISGLQLTDLVSARLPPSGPRHHPGTTRSQLKELITDINHRYPLQGADHQKQPNAMCKQTNTAATLIFGTEPEQRESSASCIRLAQKLSEQIGREASAPNQTQGMQSAAIDVSSLKKANLLLTQVATGRAPMPAADIHGPKIVNRLRCEGGSSSPSSSPAGPLGPSAPPKSPPSGPSAPSSPGTSVSHCSDSLTMINALCRPSRAPQASALTTPVPFEATTLAIAVASHEKGGPAIHERPRACPWTPGRAVAIACPFSCTSTCIAACGRMRRALALTWSRLGGIAPNRSQDNLASTNPSHAHEQNTYLLCM